MQLKCYTQAAVLSQFFEQPDYIAIFKYVQEKHCQDGMDVYYDCFYDTDIMEFLIRILFSHITESFSLDMAFLEKKNSKRAKKKDVIYNLLMSVS